ncbi:MAG TPA: hypothetical protein VJK72_04595 [Candidatus Nanoarchaeia archaeon]|nr:hypothetical protein [Candidatus Nanoarchaeia archaeon]
MIDLNEYLPRICKELHTDKVEVEKTHFGYAVIKGNWFPPAAVDHLRIDGRNIDLRGKVLHERVLIIEGEIPVRSHQEVAHELVRNIRDIGFRNFSIEYIDADRPIWNINPGESILSVYDRTGFNHGFRVEQGKVGLLYVAKALHPEFVDGNSFRMPENTYKP